MEKPQSVLILGASGRIGGDLHQRLRAQYPEMRLLGTGRKVVSGEHWQAFDPFRDDWGNLSGPFDVVVNAIGAIRPSRAMPYTRIHTDLTRRLLAERQGLGNPHIVQVSALGARLDHPVPFLQTKGTADALLLAEPDTSVVRPSVVCHPETVLQARLEKLLDGARFSFGRLLVPRGFPATRIQPIWPSDLAALIAEMVRQKPTGIVPAVGGEVFTFGDLLQMMAQAKGRSLSLVELPRKMVEGLVRNIISVWFPGVLNYDQFQLLFLDNIGDAAIATALLGRALRSTRGFWRGKPDPDALGKG
ncbi:MAG: hypothetical protein AAGN35_17150 [Bacteroidota bacterium]